MMHIILKLFPDDIGGLAAFRDYPGLEAAMHEDSCWVKAMPGLPWQKIPCQTAWHADRDGWLFHPGKAVPDMRLSDLDWRPVAELMPVRLPVSGMPAQHVRPVVMRPERSAEGPAPSFIRTGWQQWRDYALEAPLNRLQHWHFLRAGTEEAFVWGAPLPPLPGHAYVLQAERLLVPEGWLFRSKFELALLTAGLQDDSVYLFGQDGMCERIPGSAFVPATRSAVRDADKSEIL